MLWGHSISVCTLIHLYAAGLFLSLKKSMWFFSTTRPQNWTHNCQGVQCFNQCFNSLGHIPLEQVSLEILCLKPNVCSQVVGLYECPEFGISFEYSFFLDWRLPICFLSICKAFWRDCQCLTCTDSFSCFIFQYCPVSIIFTSFHKVLWLHSPSPYMISQTRFNFLSQDNCFLMFLQPYFFFFSLSFIFFVTTA